MTAEPRVTVIINSYNYAQYIGEAIDSVISQDYRNKEIIVVDDGSTDRSPNIIRSYGDAVRPLFHENLGQARTCLQAARAATGDYILFLDSDDYLLPGALTAVAAACVPGVAKVQFQLLPVGPGGEVVGTAWPAMTTQSRAELIDLIARRGTYVTPPNSGNVHSADILGYIADIDYEASIDGVAYLLAPLLGEVVQLARPLACYRYHSSNFSGHGTLDPARFALETRRHKARLAHMNRIAAEHALTPVAITDPDRHAFVLTRDIMRRVSEGRRPGAALVFAYIGALIREREGPAKTVKLTLWALATNLAPDRFRRRLAVYRSDPRSRGVPKPKAVAAPRA